LDIGLLSKKSSAILNKSVCTFFFWNTLCVISK
jgi:hypothetical protein